MRVTVWGENVHEQRDESVLAQYPESMHATIAGALRELLGGTAEIRTATLQEPEHGLGEAALASTDVLTWWGHAAHDAVDDAVVARVRDRVLGGMGLVVLHSGHYSKIFRALMGSSCTLRWRNDGERELVWTVNPAHPIAAGVPHPIVLPAHEMYGEHFDIPQPDELVFVSSFAGGEVFRSGCCFTRGRGRIFYFSPGDQEYPIYHQPAIQRVIANAVSWVAPQQAVGDPPANTHAPLDWYQGVRA
jgi:trehalose utilization protein